MSAETAAAWVAVAGTGLGAIIGGGVAIAVERQRQRWERERLWYDRRADVYGPTIARILATLGNINKSEDEHHAGLTSLMASMRQGEMIGPLVAIAGREVVNEFSRVMDLADKVVRRGEEFDSDEAGELLGKLVRTMRKDLGVPTPDDMFS